MTKNTDITKDEQRIKKLSDYTGLDEKEIKTVKNTVAEDANWSELSMFLKTASNYNLDPIHWEIYFWKDRRGKPHIMTSRDGYLTIAQRQPDYWGLWSREVHENDTFDINWQDMTVKHKQNLSEPGDIVGAWAKTERKGQKPGIDFIRFDEYNTNKGSWDKHPRAMIKKVAESRVLKKTFGISGLTSKAEMQKEMENVNPAVQENMTEWFSKKDEDENEVEVVENEDDLNSNQNNNDKNN